ncbi:MAG: glycosyltransferase [Bacteroidota bacterium]
MPNKEKVLIISYYWPPSGGPGVQRWMKFVKYMPLFGLQPVVVTVDPYQATYPVTDPGLAQEVDPSVQVYKTPTREPYALYKKIFRKKQVPYSGFTNEGNEGISSALSRFIRGNLFIPDARKGWNPYAVRKAAQLIEQCNIKLLITTSPPHSTQLAGLKLKSLFPHLKWIADLRDPWTDIFYYQKMHHLPFARKLDLALEKSVLNKADVVVTVSDHLKSIFEKKQNEGHPSPLVVIPNGFDPDDFQGFNVEPEKGIFTIGYTGTLSDSYNLSAFIKALERLLSKGNYNLRMNVAGHISSQWSDKLSDVLVGRLVNQGHVNHRQAIGTMLQSDLLLLVIPQMQQNEGIITGKIFEYLAARRPVLGIGPLKGDAASVLGQTKSGRMFDFDDHEGIENFLLDFMEGKSRFEPDFNMVNSYSRKALTSKLASIASDLLLE